MHLQVLRIDIRDLLQGFDRLFVISLQELEPRYLVPNHAVARIFGTHDREILQRGIVIAIRLLDQRTEVVGASQIWIHGERFLNKGLGAFRLAFLDQRPRDIQPTIGIARLGFGDFSKSVFCAFYVALQQQPDAPVVPAFARLLCL